MVVVAAVLLQTAMATMTLVELWKAATVQSLAGLVVALLATVGAALAGALAMPLWRMVTPPHLLRYAALPQA